MRSKKLLRNTMWSTLGYIGYALAGFVSRMIFVNTLGDTINGVATLFSSILNLLSLAELGFGSAIVLHLYKPVAENDQKKIAALVNLYEKVYRAAAGIVLVLGVVLLPFLQYLVKTDDNIENLRLYFFLYVLKAALSYLYSYRSVVIGVNQDSYVSTNISNIFLILMTFLQALALHFTNSFVLYLIIPIVGTLVSNIAIHCKASRLYPYLAQNRTERVSREELREILKFIKATAIDRVSSVLKLATDNIIVSAFVNVTVTGIVGNYNMVITMATTILGFFFNNAVPAMGNLTVSESRERQYDTLLDFQFVTFWLYGFAATGLLCTLTPFVTELWLHKASLVLPDTTLFLLIANFYLLGVAIPMAICFNVNGYIKKAPYVNFINVLVNLGVSLALVRPLGTNGVYIGTIVSLLVTSLWFMPYFVCKHSFDGDHKRFWSLFARGMLAVLLAAAPCVWLCGKVEAGGIGGFVLRILICTALFNAIYVLCFRRSKRMRSILGLVKNILRRS